jgi:hypothetical protein
MESYSLLCYNKMDGKKTFCSFLDKYLRHKRFSLNSKAKLNVLKNTLPLFENRQVCIRQKLTVFTAKRGQKNSDHEKIVKCTNLE